MSSYLNQVYVDAARADWHGDDFTSRKKIVVTKEAVHGNPTNIRVKVDFNNSDEALYFALTQYRIGAMLMVCTEDGTEIPCEAGARQNDLGVGGVRLFFLAPSLSSSEDTIFYLYYGSSQDAPRVFTDSETWKPAFKGIWHEGYEVVGAYATAIGRE